MSRLRTTIIATLAVVLGTLVPPAGAHQESRSFGRCGLHTVAQETATGDADHFVGAIDAQIVVWSPDHGNPVTATVTCDLRVDGVSQDTATGSGVGLVAFAGRIEYDATDAQDAYVCTIVDFTSDETPTHEDCGHTTNLPFPPPLVVNTLDYGFGAVNWVITSVFDVVDPVACAAIAALAPGIPPLTVVDGDLYLDNVFLYDCPPYESTPAPWSPPVGTAPTGVGWNDGTHGSLTLATKDDAGVVAATCAFRRDPATGEVAVTGVAVGSGPATVRCVLRDAATGTVVYDESAAAALSDHVVVAASALDVCTEGTAGAAGTGLHCRLGRPAGDGSD